MNEDDIDEGEFFPEKAWSDGLPVVTPTVARVGEMETPTLRYADPMARQLTV
jgi:hypothetical protein